MATHDIPYHYRVTHPHPGAPDRDPHARPAALGAALEARRGERLQRAYLAVLAHELRNPLGAIASAVEVLARVGGQATPEVRAREVIKRQVQQLTQMLEALHGTPGGEVDPLEAVPLDLAATVCEAVQLAQDRQGIQRMNRHLGALAPQPVWIKADPAALTQLALCLLDEARAQSSEGAILASVFEEQGHAVLRVQAGRVAKAGHVAQPEQQAQPGYDAQSEREGQPKHEVPPENAMPPGHVAPAASTAVMPPGRRSIGLAWARRLVQAQGGFFQVVEGAGDVGTCYEVRFARSESAGC
jgi:hypothetical protein